MEEGRTKMNRRRKYNKPSGSRRISKGSCEDALSLSDELDVDMTSEFPGLKVGGRNVLTSEEQEVVEDIPRTFGKVADPVRIYLDELKSFPLLTREGEV